MRKLKTILSTGVALAVVLPFAPAAAQDASGMTGPNAEENTEDNAIIVTVINAINDLKTIAIIMFCITSGTFFVKLVQLT